MLQPSKWVVHKQIHKAKSKYFYAHILLHFGLAMLLVWNVDYLISILIIVVLHGVIDLLKLYTQKVFKNAALPFFIDQGLHILVLLIVVYFNGFWDMAIDFFNHLNWGLLTAVVFLGFPSAIFMHKLMLPMSEQIPIDHRSLPNAGKYIGMIERILVFIFILLNKWEAIGLLIAAKSVFRFNDLKESNNRKLTEYILIGTLLSFSMAILTGLAYQYFFS